MVEVVKLREEMHMDFGMPTLIENNTLEENVFLCRELGLQFIELNMNFPLYQIQQLENTDYLLQLAEENGIYYTIHLSEDMNVCDFNPDVAGAFRRTAVRALEAAKKIKAPLLNMHMNHGIYVTLPDKKVWIFEKYRKQYEAAVREFRELLDQAAAGTDIKMCIENTDGYQDFEKEAIEFYLQSEHFALTWDIGHSHVCGNIDEEFLMTNRDRLRHFHIHDALGDKNHQTLGSGEIDLRQRIGIAQACGCRCVVETKTIEALKRSVAWLKEEGMI